MPNAFFPAVLSRAALPNANASDAGIPNRPTANEPQAAGDSGPKRASIVFKTFASELESASGTANVETAHPVDRPGEFVGALADVTVGKKTAHTMDEARPTLGTGKAEATDEWVEKPIRIPVKLKAGRMDETWNWQGVQPDSAVPVPPVAQDDASNAAPAGTLPIDEAAPSNRNAVEGETPAQSHSLPRWPATEPSWHTPAKGTHSDPVPLGKGKAGLPETGEVISTIRIPATASPEAADLKSLNVASAVEYEARPETVIATSSDGGERLAPATPGLLETPQAPSREATAFPDSSPVDGDMPSAGHATTDVVDADAPRNDQAGTGELRQSYGIEEEFELARRSLSPEREQIQPVIGEGPDGMPGAEEITVPPRANENASIRWEREVDAFLQREVATPSTHGEPVASIANRASHLSWSSAFGDFAPREPAEGWSPPDDSSVEALSDPMQDKAQAGDVVVAESVGLANKATSPLFPETVANARPAFNLSGQVAEALVLREVHHGRGGENVSQLRVELDPPRLGNLALEITQGDQSVRVRIVAESANTHFLLQQERQGLIDLFQDQGRSVEVDISWQQQQDFRGQRDGERTSETQVHRWRAEGAIRDTSTHASRSQIISEHTVDITI